MSKSIHFRCPDKLFEDFQLYMKTYKFKSVTEAAIQLFEDGMRQEYWENRSLQEMDSKINTILASVLRNTIHTTELTQHVAEGKVSKAAEKKWSDVKNEKGYGYYEDED